MSDEKDKTEAKEAPAAQPVTPQPAATPDQQSVELTVSDLKLQEFAGIMLEQIMSQGFSNGEVITREIKDAN